MTKETGRWPGERLRALGHLVILSSCHVLSPMDKQQVARVLDEIGTLLELQGESFFRCQAYHNAARAIEQLEENLADVLSSGRLGDIRGIGDTMREKVAALVTTGELPFYNQLREKIPPGLLQMLRLPGLGPKKVKAQRSEEHTSELQSHLNLVCRLLLEKKKKNIRKE